MDAKHGLSLTLIDDADSLSKDSLNTVVISLYPKIFCCPSWTSNNYLVHFKNNASYIHLVWNYERHEYMSETSAFQFQGLFGFPEQTYPLVGTLESIG